MALLPHQRLGRRRVGERAPPRALAGDLQWGQGVEVVKRERALSSLGRLAAVPVARARGHADAVHVVCAGRREVADEVHA